jgi:hypothetical protein
MTARRTSARDRAALKHRCCDSSIHVQTNDPVFYRMSFSTTPHYRDDAALWQSWNRRRTAPRGARNAEPASSARVKPEMRESLTAARRAKPSSRRWPIGRRAAARPAIV